MNEKPWRRLRGETVETRLPIRRAVAVIPAMVTIVLALGPPLRAHARGGDE